jgi:hypothetical protein
LIHLLCGDDTWRSVSRPYSSDQRLRRPKPAGTIDRGRRCQRLSIEPDGTRKEEVAMWIALFSIAAVAAIGLSAAAVMVQTGQEDTQAADSFACDVTD